MDIAIALDDTGSMGGAIANIVGSLPAIIDQAQAASGPDGLPDTADDDLRLGYTTFKDDVTVHHELTDNLAAVEASIAGTIAGDGADQAAILEDDALTSGGVFITTAADGTGTADAIMAIIETCGTANEEPDCSTAAPSVASLWPPNHKMQSVTIEGVTDADEDEVTITITGIFQDEPTNGLGDGDKSPDGAGVGTSTAEVRSERSGTGDDRVYHIMFSADDGNGGSCTGEVLVTVPHDQDGAAAIDQGAQFDSTVA